MNEAIITYQPNRKLSDREISELYEIFDSLGYSPLVADSYCFINHENKSEAHATIAIQAITWHLDWFNKSIKTLNIYRVESFINADFIADHASKGIRKRLPSGSKGSRTLEARDKGKGFLTEEGQ